MQLVGIQIYNLDIARIKNNTKRDILSFLGRVFRSHGCLPFSDSVFHHPIGLYHTGHIHPSLVTWCMGGIFICNHNYFICDFVMSLNWKTKSWNNITIYFITHNNFEHTHLSCMYVYAYIYIYICVCVCLCVCVFCYTFCYSCTTPGKLVGYFFAVHQNR